MQKIIELFNDLPWLVKYTIYFWISCAAVAAIVGITSLLWKLKLKRLSLFISFLLQFTLGCLFLYGAIFSLGAAFELNNWLVLIFPGLMFAGSILFFKGAFPVLWNSIKATPPQDTDD